MVEYVDSRGFGIGTDRVLVILGFGIGKKDCSLFSSSMVSSDVTSAILYGQLMRVVNKLLTVY